jgi:hypothetical protein
MCPPTLDTNQATNQPPPQQSLYQGSTNKVVLSCGNFFPPLLPLSSHNLQKGHVECNLESSSVKDIVSFLELVKQGFVEPSSIDSDYGEYHFTSPSLPLSTFFPFSVIC